MVSRWLEEDVLVAVLSNGVANVHAVEKAAADLLFPPGEAARWTSTSQPYDLTSYGVFETKEGLSFDVAKDARPDSG